MSSSLSPGTSSCSNSKASALDSGIVAFVETISTQNGSFFCRLSAESSSCLTVTVFFCKHRGAHIVVILGEVTSFGPSFELVFLLIMFPVPLLEGNDVDGIRMGRKTSSLLGISGSSVFSVQHITPLRSSGYAGLTLRADDSI
nr:hypothetical protein Iba_chr15fCG2590 [Ipomoea batatas]